MPARFSILVRIYTHTHCATTQWCVYIQAHGAAYVYAHACVYTRADGYIKRCRRSFLARRQCVKRCGGAQRFSLTSKFFCCWSDVAMCADGAP